jgi:hypothetical protein
VQLATRETVPQVPDQFVVVPLANAKEIHDLEIKVVQDLHVRGRLVKKYLRAASECLHVGEVLGQHRDDFRGEAILPANIGQGADHKKRGNVKC